MLLTRDDFRNSVFERDGHKCVICGAPAKDAHHIIERRLWVDHGYYLDNGASLCEQHHMEAEMTTLSCDEIRRAAGITRVVVPPHLYDDTQIDKWGNPILPDGKRLRGELFYDESVQKILGMGGVLSEFVTYVKYPRTCHLPWSPGMKNDDRMIENLQAFEGKRVIATIKMDGEQTTMYSDYIHARSINSGNHPSRNWAKAIHGQIQGNIPEGWRVCGENLYAKHSIEYGGLPSYLMMFSIWNEKNFCLSWDETVEWAQLLGLPTVPVIYDGIWDEKTIKGLYTPKYDGNECEGYVVRLADAFPYRDFKYAVGKYVRKNHVVTHGHWMRQQIVPNKLKTT